MSRPMIILVMFFIPTLAAMMTWADLTAAMSKAYTGSPYKAPSQSYIQPHKVPSQINETYPSNGGSSQSMGDYPTPVKVPSQINETYPSNGSGTTSASGAKHPRSTKTFKRQCYDKCVVAHVCDYGSHPDFSAACEQQCAKSCGY